MLRRIDLLIVATGLLLLASLLGPVESYPRVLAQNKELSTEKRALLKDKANVLWKPMFEAIQASDFDKALALGNKITEYLDLVYPQTIYPAGNEDFSLHLNFIGVIHKSRGQPAIALKFFTRAYEMDKRLFPKAQYPKGTAHLANSLQAMGTAHQELGQFDEALMFCKKALKMNMDLYPQGHAFLATSLNNIGSIHEVRGELETALDYFEQALKMRQTLYAKMGNKDGETSFFRFEIPISLNNLGNVLDSLGEPEKALSKFGEALPMFKNLYPNGDTRVIACQNNLASVLVSLNRGKTGLAHLEDSLKMCKSLYPKEDHPDWLHSLHGKAGALMHLSRPDDALVILNKTKIIVDKVYKGQPELRDLGLGEIYNNLGTVQLELNRPNEALTNFRDALEISKKRFPEKNYPDGHPHLITMRNNLARTYLRLNRQQEAYDCARQVLEMESKQFHRASSGLSVRLFQQLLTDLRSTVDVLLSCSTGKIQSESDVYGAVMRVKGISTMLQKTRHEGSLIASKKNAKLGALWTEYVSSQKQIADSIWSPRDKLASKPEDQLDWVRQEKYLQVLYERRDKLERNLIKLLPELTRKKEWASWEPKDLTVCLPRETVMIDFLRFFRSDVQDKKWHFVAFVLSPGQDAQRVDLGPAEPLEQLCNQWREMIEAGDENERVRTLLAEKVWAKLAPHLPQGTRTLYLSLDGNLARIPWGALPSSSKSGVLLEEFKGGIAVVPSSIWLLDQLKYPPMFKAGPQKALAVGDVKGFKRPLPGSKYEIQNLQRLTEQINPGQRKATVLKEGEATRERVLQELAKARYALISTHGFFDEQGLQEERRRAKAAIEKFALGREEPWQRGGLGAQNPLSYVGLQLANAYTAEGEPDPAGIATGDHLLGLDLKDLRVVVLSACQTGLGELTAAEGVEGLQRMFHVCGCPNAVATLWDARDQPTAAITTVFFWELFRNPEKTPLEALRAAQLYVYRNPEQIARIARYGVAPNQAHLPTDPLGGETAQTYVWAAFILSGTGR